ncbi:MAG: hydrolase [Gemmatimonadetes bacterium]|nr:hydrolase [Gemmatimonadota bacterium]
MLLALPTPLLAQAPASPAAAVLGVPTTPAVRMSDAPVIDGLLEEAAWNGIEPLSSFIQRIPLDGQPATHATDVRVGYDASALYVGIRAHDPQADQIVPGEGIRDTDLSQSDALVLVFDTYRDGVNGFVFGTNPAGVEYDGQVVDQGGGSGGLRGGGLGPGRQQGGSGDGFNLNWDGSWEVATHRDETGWSAEFRIPFSTLRYRAGARQDWGFNVLRRVRRLNEDSYWSPISRQFDLYRVSEAGSLAGLEPPAGRSVQVTPYALGSSSRNYAIGQGSFDENKELGADAKVQITQGLTLDLTYNTDFAQVEVDDVQTNLTRFSIQFPEKRPFFLENSGMFAVGGGGADLFFSRRIGIARNGTRVPIQGGGRLSGKVAGLNVGVLHIRTEDLDGVQSEQAYSVGRVAKELGNRTSVGAVFLQRDGTEIDDDYNRTYGIDGQLGIGSALNLNANVARTVTPGLDGRDHLINTGINYNSRSLTLQAAFREVGEDFNPEVGFLQRSGYRFYNLRWMSYVRPKALLGLRELRPHAHYKTTRSLENGFEETSEIHVDSHFEWSSGMFFSPAFNWIREGLERPFEISKAVVVAPGTYAGWEGAWHFYTNQSAPVTFETTWGFGDFLSGTRQSNAAIVGVRLGSAVSTALRLERNEVNLAEGDFTTRLAGVRLGYFFNPQIYLQSLVQYSDQANNWSANLRFGWLSTAGTGLFVVYNQAHGVDSLSGPLNRSLIVKYSRRFTVFGG